MWVLTIGVLEVYPHCHSIRAQRGRARSALFSRVLINFDIFPLEFNFSKIFVNKNAIKSATPSKILSFDRKIKFFSLIFLIGGKILPEIEFFP